METAMHLNAFDLHSGLAQDRFTLEHAPLAEQKSTIYRPYVSHTLESILPSSSNDKQHNLQLCTTGLGTASSSMDPPPKKRKRKAPTLHADVWDPYKSRILELHTSQGLSLKEVQKIIKAETGFSANLRQYRTRISQWGLDKNTKPSEMRAIVRKQQHRKLVEREKRPFTFRIRGKVVVNEQINRYMKRNRICESTLYALSPTTSTPSALSCSTISEKGSPVSSPTRFSTTSSPILRFAHAAYGYQHPSPTLSTSKLIQFPESTVTSQNPAPLTQYHSKPVDTFYSLRGITAPSLDLPYRVPTPAEGNFFLRPDYREAELMHKQTLKQRQSIFGQAHPDTLSSMASLAEIYQKQGRWKEAEDLQLPVMETSKRVLREEHHDTLGSMASLAETYSAQGRWEEAEDLELLVMETRKRVLGEEHPHTLGSMASLAVAYSAQGRWKEAEDLELPVMETRKRVLGEEHPHTLSSMASLVVTYRKQGRWNEAKDLESRVLEKRVLIPGELSYSHQ